MLGVKTAALPASLRRTNQRTVISFLLRLGSASRADLAKAAGISQPTAGKIIAELLHLGILQEAGSALEQDENGSTGSPRLGRPGQLLRLDHRKPRFVAIELGVAETNISALPVAISLEDKWACRFPTPKSPEPWLKKLKSIASEIQADQLWGVLVSVPGIVDERAGKVLFSPNLHWSEKTELPQLIRQAWNLPVLLVQEIRALALGHLTAHPGGDDFLLIDFGEGVGGAIVLDGKLYSHPMPLSGEFGHTPVFGNRRRCGCGAVGCLETLVSERGLLESFAGSQSTPLKTRPRRAGPRPHPGHPDEGSPPAPANHSVYSSTEVTGRSEMDSTLPRWKDLVECIRKRGVEAWLAETLDATARIVAGALNVLGVHRVIVTGRLCELPGCVEHLSAGINKGAMWARFGAVTCEAAPHRRAAGLVASGMDRLILPAGVGSGMMPPFPPQTIPSV
jgi:predicted NBD/HSP70 family sugar kinase